MQSVMQTHVRTAENLYNWVLSVVVCCLPHHLSVFVCRALVLLSFQVGCLSALVWLVLSSPLSSPRLTPFFLAFCQRSQEFRWNDAVTKGARQRLPDMPSQVFVFWGPPSLPPPPLIPPHHHLPRILENRKYILLSDGWAPCSCWEERKKSLSFPPGQSDEFSSLKAEGRLCFFGSVLEPSEPECLEATGTCPLCVRRELIADKVQSGVFALGKWIGN